MLFSRVYLFRFPGRLWFIAFAFLAFGMSHSSGQVEIGPPNFDPLAVPQNWYRLDNPGEFNFTAQAAASDGSLWLAEEEGIVHYDGFKWRVFGEGDGLDSTPARAVLVGADDSVYALSRIGFYRMQGDHWRKLASVRFEWEAMNPLYEAQDGTVFAGVEDGFIELHPDGRLKEWRLDSGIVSFCEDGRGSLWLVEGVSRAVYRALLTPDGLAPRSTWQRMLAPSEAPIQFSVLRRSSDGHIWLSSMKHDDPLRAFDLETNEWRVLDLSAYMGSNLVTSIAPRQEGGIWVVGEGWLAVVGFDGLVRKYRSPEVPLPQARLFVEEASDGYLLVTELGTRSYRVDTRGRRWARYVGLHFQSQAFGQRWFVTENHTLVSSRGNGKRWFSYKGVPEVIDGAVAAHITRDGTLWVIGSHQGIAAVSRYDGEKWELQRFPDFATGIAPSGFYQADDGTVYLGSGQHWDWHPKLKGGYLRLVPTESEGWDVEEGARGEIAYKVQSLVGTGDGVLFFASGRGLSVLDETGLHWADEAPGGLSKAWIQSLASSGKGDIWGSVWGKGILNRDVDRNWRVFTVDDGLDSNFAMYVFVSRFGSVLSLTESGLQRFDGRAWSKFFDLGLPYSLPRRSGLIREETDGTLWVNVAHHYWFTRLIQNNGYEAGMNPDFGSWRYVPETQAPSTEIIGDAEAKRKDERAIDLLLFGSDPWSLTPIKDLEFSFRLDGGSWSDYRKERRLSFSSLSEGKHLLEARARDRDLNVDATPASFAFVVDLPFWQEGWFLPLAIGLMVTGFVVLILFIRQSSKHSLQLEEQKMSLFTNLSHELRTPLTLIAAPLERLCNMALSKEAKTYVGEASRSTHRLTEVIDQLLEFRRLQTGKMPVKVGPLELVGFCQNLLFAFEILAEEKRQALSFVSHYKQFTAAVDSDKLQIILTNLISNAVKYCPEGSKIRVKLDVFRKESPQEILSLVVEDDGPGISEEILDRLFQPFSRGDDDSVNEVQGSGLGLAFAREVAQRCGGSLLIESNGEESRGTKAILEMPLTPISATEAQSDIERKSDANELLITRLEDVDEETLAQESANKRRLIVVEDHDEVRRYLRRELSDTFDVVEAESGEKAWELIKQKVPDLVLADLNLGGMSGQELCALIRKDERLSNLPFVLLTASRSEAEELAALEVGADAFLRKPFKVALLRRRLINLARSRPAVGDDNSGLKEEDARFLHDVKQIVNERFHDYLFDVDELSRRMGMSRSSFYRRLRGVTKESPSQLIRNRRLSESAKLLRETRGTVSEIFEKSGFIDKRTFNKAFKDYFKKTPLEYRKGK